MRRSATIRSIGLVIFVAVVVSLTPSVVGAAPADICRDTFEDPERRARCRDLLDAAASPPDAGEQADAVDDETGWIADAPSTAADGARGIVGSLGSETVERATGDAGSCQPPEPVQDRVQDLRPDLFDLELGDGIGGDGDAGSGCPLGGGVLTDAGATAGTVPAERDAVRRLGSRSGSTTASPSDRPAARIGQGGANVVPDPGGAPVLWSAVLLASAVPLWLLYRRLTRDDLLDHELRQEIVETLERRPGMTTGAIAEEVDVHYTTARHHLDLLVEFDELHRRRDGQRIRHFPNHGRLQPEEMTLAAKIRDRSRRRIVRTLIRDGPMNTSDLAEQIGAAKSTVSHHLGVLTEAGLLDRSREGRSVRYAVRDWVRGRLEKLS